MKQLFNLAWRSIWRNRRRTIITVSSITLSLAFAVFFIALGDGVYAKLINSAVRMQAGHMTVEDQKYGEAPAVDLVLDNLDTLKNSISNIAGIEKTKALIVGQGVAKSGAGAVGALLVGVEPLLEVENSPLAKKIIAGSYLQGGKLREVIVGKQMIKRLKLSKRKEALRLATALSPAFAIYGVPTQKLADELSVHLAVGKKMVVGTNNVNGELVEELVHVAGVFETGAVEIDAYLVQMSIDSARMLFGMRENQATQLGILVKDYEKRDQILEKVKSALGNSDMTVKPWEEILPDLAAYIKVDKGSNIIFQGIFIFLIMFIIFNTILMSVLERRREFAMLLALGTQLSRIKLQILIESAMIGFLGCLFGLGIGGGSAYLVQVYGIDLSKLMDDGLSISGFAVDSVLQARITMELLGVMGLVVFGATLLISLYPMGQIKHIRIVDALK